MMRTLVVIGALLALQPSTVAAQVRIQTHRLSDRITVLSPSEGSGNTIVFKGSNGILLIDTMADSISDHLHRELTALDALGIKFIFNTHWHHNHLSGNSRYSDRAVVFGAPETRGRLAAPQTLKFIVQETFPRLPETAWPTVIFPDSMSLHFNGEEIKAWHVRGHTDTDVIVYIPGLKLVCTGDLFRMGGAILADLDTGGNMLGVVEALRGLVARVPLDATVVPGHGAFGKVSDIDSYVRALDATIAFVRREIGAGRSLAEIQKMTPPAGTEGFVGRNPAKPLEAVFRSVQDRR